MVTMGGPFRLFFYFPKKNISGFRSKIAPNDIEETITWDIPPYMNNWLSLFVSDANEFELVYVS